LVGLVACSPSSFAYVMSHPSLCIAAMWNPPTNGVLHHRLLSLYLFSLSLARYLCVCGSVMIQGRKQNLPCFILSTLKEGGLGFC